MNVTMLWHGGADYAAPTDEDGERFPSLAAAVAEFESREHDIYYPCVDRIPPEDGGPEAWVFFGNDVGDCPDRLISFGPRGGVRVTRA